MPVLEVQILHEVICPLNTLTARPRPQRAIEFHNNPCQLTHHLLNFVFAPPNNIPRHYPMQHYHKDIDKSNRVWQANRIGFITIVPNRFDTASNLLVVWLILLLVPDGMNKGFCCCE